MGDPLPERTKLWAFYEKRTAEAIHPNDSDN